MPDSQYNVNILIKSTDQSSAPAKQASKGMMDLQKAAQAAAIAYGALKTAQKLVDFVEFGAQANRSAAALDNLARAAGTSGDAIVGAIRTASQFTIDSLTAMQVANRAMIMDVAETPAQFEKLTKVAVALGRAMGVDAATSIDNFVTAAGRQSRLVADNLGLLIKAEDAYANYAASLGIAADELTLTQQKQAFLNEMLVQGEAKMQALGDQTLDTAGKFEQIKALSAELKTNLGKAFVEGVEQVGFLGVKLSDVGTALEWINRLLSGPEIQGAITGYNGYRVAVEEVTEVTRISAAEFNRAKAGIPEYINLMQQMAAAQNALVPSTTNVSNAVDLQGAAFKAAYNASLGYNYVLEDNAYAQQQVLDAARDSVIAQDELRSAIESARIETINATIAQEGLAAQLMDASGAQVATIMINMLSQSLLSGRISQEAYRAGVQSLQIQFGLATPETIALAAAMQGLNTALAGGEIDAAELGAQVAALREFQLQQAQAAVGAAKATAGAGAASRDASKASREHEAALREQERALLAQERAAQRAAEAYHTLAQRLKEASKEQIAGILIDKLTASMEAGEISIDKYNRAVSKLLLGFGLATPESMQLATGLQVLLDAFAGGDMMSKELVAALNKLVGSTTGATSNTYNINDPTAAAIFGDQARRDSRASYATSAGG